MIELSLDELESHMRETQARLGPLIRERDQILHELTRRDDSGFILEAVGTITGPGSIRAAHFRYSRAGRSFEVRVQEDL